MRAYTIKQVAEFCQVTVATIRKEIDRNRLKCFYVGADPRISEEELARYMDVIANNYKTSKEVELEKENAALRDKYNRLVKHVEDFKNGISLLV